MTGPDPQDASGRFERFFELSREMLCIIGFDGYFRELNGTWETALGLKRETLKSQPIIDLVHAEDRADTLRALHGLAHGQEACSFENRCASGSDGYRWIRWNAAASADEKLIYAVASDITSFKMADIQVMQANLLKKEILRLERQARKDAEEQRARLFALFEQAPALAAVLHGHDFVFELANEASRRLLGNRGLIGKRLTEAVPSLDPKVLSLLTQVYETGQRAIERDYVVHADWLANGKVSAKLFTFILEPTFDLGGGVDGIWVMAFDVTESKALESRLRLSERMASIGTLAAGVAHEINNPLSFITANLGLALDELREDPEQAIRSLQCVRRGADRVRDIVKSLKVFSRNDEEKVELVDLREVLSMSVDVVGNEIRHRALLSETYEPLPPVRANRGRLCQVFINLLINATQAIEVGTAESNMIEVRARADGAGKVIVEVSDSGRGIPAEIIDRIFDPFFTSKPIGEGTGLGLSICHGIISALNGEISVRSEAGVGTTFRVTLPAEASASSEVEAAQPNRPTSCNRNLNILVIDDEYPLGDAIGRILRKDRHIVTVVDQARRGLELVRGGSDSGPEYDLILCDLMMPEMTGMDVYEEVRKLQRGLEERIIFMTGGAFTERSKEWLSRVPNRLLEKPFDAEELREMIRAVE